MRLFVVLTLLIYACLVAACDSVCVYGNCESGIYLTVKREIPHTSVQVDDVLELDLREYFQLGKDKPGGTFVGYPTITPHITPAPIAKVAYDYQTDRHGQQFRIQPLEAGRTMVKLHLSWDGGGDTGGTAERRVQFLLFVED